MGDAAGGGPVGGGAWRGPNWPPQPPASTVDPESILRLAVWELISTPPRRRVVIDEAIEIAREFFTSGTRRGFINGVMDAILKDTRR